VADLYTVAIQVQQQVGLVVAVQVQAQTALQEPQAHLDKVMMVVQVEHMAVEVAGQVVMVLVVRVHHIPLV
jgi:hypothetical protein